MEVEGDESEEEEEEGEEEGEEGEEGGGSGSGSGCALVGSHAGINFLIIHIFT